MFLLSALLLLLAAPAATADIYRYLDEDGVVCYTDTPSSKAVMYMKESRHSDKFPTSRKSIRAKRAAYVVPATQKVRTASVLPVPGRITSVVGLRNDPINGILRTHQGFDIAAPTGTPIRAVDAGRVLFSGTRQGYGKTVMVEHDDGMITLYAHNSLNLVNEGDRVSETTILALTGSTGHSTGPHLHFEAWKDGTNITSSILANTYGAVSSLPSPPSDGIRRLVGSDGTLIFTNLR